MYIISAKIRLSTDKGILTFIFYYFKCKYEGLLIERTPKSFLQLVPFVELNNGFRGVWMDISKYCCAF